MLVLLVAFFDLDVYPQVVKLVTAREESKYEVDRLGDLLDDYSFTLKGRKKMILKFFIWIIV